MTSSVRFSRRLVAAWVAYGVVALACGVLMMIFPAFSEGMIVVGRLPLAWRRFIGFLLVVAGVVYFWGRVFLVLGPRRNAIDLQSDEVVVRLFGGKESRFRRVGGNEVSVDPEDGALLVHHASGTIRLRRWWLNEGDLQELLNSGGAPAA